MSLWLHKCLPCVLGASPSRLLVLFTILVTLPASLNDQSKSFPSFTHPNPSEKLSKNTDVSFIVFPDVSFTHVH